RLELRHRHWLELWRSQHQPAAGQQPLTSSELGARDLFPCAELLCPVHPERPAPTGYADANLGEVRRQYVDSMSLRSHPVRDHRCVQNAYDRKRDCYEGPTHRNPTLNDSSSLRKGPAVTILKRWTPLAAASRCCSTGIR